MRIKYKDLIIAFIGLINIIIHLVPCFNFEFQRDELLYFSFCNHLDFGYATSPPFIGLMAYISKSIFGYTVFSARFFPSLFSGLLVILAAITAKELNGNFRSQVISAIGITGSMFLVMVYGVFSPYYIDIFFWTLTILLIIKFVKSRANKYLILLGIVAGVAFLNKYSIVFLIFSILIVIPFTKYRNIFFNKYLYIGILLSILIAAPNILWQIYHHFPVLNHMRELNDSQLVNVNRVEFIIEQFIFLLPFTLITLPGIIFFLINKQLKDFRFLLSVTGVVIILFLVLKGKSYYASGLYPFLIVVGALFIGKVVTNLYVYSFVLMILISSSLLLLPLNLPFFNPQKMVSYFDRFAAITGVDLLRKDENGNYGKLPQLYADMLGWNEITEKTSIAWSKVEDKSKSIIFCSNYGQAGAVSIIGKKKGLPDPVSFCDAYRYWLPGKFDNEIIEMVYVVGADALNSVEFTETKNFFSETIEIGNIENELAIEYNTKIYLFKKPRGNFNDFWQGQIGSYLK